MRKTKALNIVQLLYVPSAQTCVTIPAPIQLLPQANWSTLIVRLRKWQFFSGGGLGRAWRRLGGDALAAIADAVPFVLVQFVKDSLITNQCLVCEEQMGWRLVSTPARRRLLYDLDCMHHQAALCARACCEPPLASTLVRFGNLLDSNKNIDKMDAVIDKFVNSRRFRYRAVHEYPAEFDAWRSHAAAIMHLTKGALDLSRQERRDLLEFDNGDWKDDVFTHWCLHGHCRFCGAPHESLGIELGQ